MKLIFIGTSHGVPEADRRCSSCILQIGSAYYIIDMGTQTIEDLRRRNIDVGDVRCVICTHPHGDHTNGIISFVDLINWYFTQADPVILLPDKRLIPPLLGWVGANSSGNGMRDGLRISAYEEGIVYRDEYLCLTAIPTQHCDNSYALLAEAEGKKILFTGDLHRPPVDFPEVAFETEIDLIVCELAHFGPDDCAPIFERTKAKRIIHNHINESRFREQLDARLSAPHAYEYAVAFDGMELEL